MQRQIWNKPGQWLHNLEYTTKPTLFTTFFFLFFFSFFFFFLTIHVFCLWLLDIYTSHSEFHPIFIFTHYLTQSYLFIFLFIFFTLIWNLSQLPFKSLLSLLYSPISLSHWWRSKFFKHDCISHNSPLVLLLLFCYDSTYEAKDYGVFEERNNGLILVYFEDSSSTLSAPNSFQPNLLFWPKLTEIAQIYRNTLKQAEILSEK